MSIETIGRLHPLLVHMPIAFLPLALAAEAYRPRTDEEARSYAGARRLLWLLGAASAAASCITGLLLEGEGGHVGDLTDRHKWSAIATTLLASFGYASTLSVEGGPGHRLLRRSMRIGVLTGLLLTGHFGGSITHGEGYVTSMLPKPPGTRQTRETVQDGASGNKGRLPNARDRVQGSTSQRDGNKDSGDAFKEWPAEDVQEADPALLTRLRSTGMVILPVEPGKGYLQATLMNLSIPADSAAGVLGALSRQLVWLKADVKDLTDSGCARLARLTNLTRLSMAGSAVTDRGLSRLAGLANLHRLNLTGTAVTERGLQAIGRKQALKELYLFGTPVDRDSLGALDSLFPSAVIDTGGYRLQRTSSDTLGKGGRKERR